MQLMDRVSVWTRAPSAYDIQLSLLQVVCGLLIALTLAPAAQEDAPRAPSYIEAHVGVIVNVVMLGEDGTMFVGPVEVVGQSPDDLFTYWLGRNSDDSYFGYDVYSGVWMPGPVEYRRSVLEFQEELIEGWIRIFAGMPDYRRFFGNDGRIYERYQNYYSSDHVYTYFVDMTSGERSDSTQLIDFLSHNRQWLEIIVEQQRDQALEIRERADQLGRAYSNWQEGAHIPPAQVSSVGDAIYEIILPETIAGLEEPSLLELIEDELTGEEQE